jgi:hypothetical protein
LYCINWSFNWGGRQPNSKKKEKINLPHGQEEGGKEEDCFQEVFEEEQAPQIVLVRGRPLERGAVLFSEMERYNNGIRQ